MRIAAAKAWKLEKYRKSAPLKSCAGGLSR
jgi:hypothetical protein